MSRIARLVALVLLGAAVCQPRPAAADADYPKRPIRLIVPYAPGGVPDTSARLLAQKLQARIDQSVFVENRPGGNGGVAAAVINTSPADGYTLMVVDTTLLSVGPISSTTYPLIRKKISCRLRLSRARRCSWPSMQRRRSRRSMSSSLTLGRIPASSIMAPQVLAARIS
jgi:hypothetical protein